MARVNEIGTVPNAAFPATASGLPNRPYGYPYRCPASGYRNAALPVTFCHRGKNSLGLATSRHCIVTRGHLFEGRVLILRFSEVHAEEVLQATDITDRHIARLTGAPQTLGKSESIIAGFPGIEAPQSLPAKVRDLKAGSAVRP